VAGRHIAGPANRGWRARVIRRHPGHVKGKPPFKRDDDAGEQGVAEQQLDLGGWEPFQFFLSVICDGGGRTNCSAP
jgi:hypothetical protein